MIMEGYVQILSGGKLKRYVQFLEISEDPELVAQYRKWHSEEYSWKEVRDGIREVGILEMEIYILGSKLVMIVDTPLDFEWEEAMARLLHCRDRLSGRLSFRSSRAVLLMPAVMRNGNLWNGCFGCIKLR